MPDPTERLHQVCAAAALEPTTPPRRVESYSNDVWLLDDARLGAIVLRVAWRGDLARLERETAVMQRLSPHVRCPQVVGHGRTALRDVPLTYSLTRRLSGHSLAERWTSLTTSERRTAVAQLADTLRELHRWTPPADMIDLVRARPSLRLDTVDAIVGADVTPLPIARTLALAPHALSLPHVDPGLVRAAIAAIEDLEHLDPVLDDPSRHGLIHGDVHLFNLWWSEPGTTTLLDFEWVRFGPPDLDLQRLCDNADADALTGSDTHPTLLRWLAAEYPELFRGEALPARLRLYSLAFAIRHLIVAPPDRPADALGPVHTLHRLRRLVDGRWPAPGSLPDSLMPSA